MAIEWQYLSPLATTGPRLNVMPENNEFTLEANFVY